MWRQSFLFLFSFPVCSENEAFLFSALCSPQSCLTRLLPADRLPFSARFGWKQSSVFWGRGRGQGRLYAYSWLGCPKFKWVIVCSRAVSFCRRFGLCDARLYLLCACVYICIYMCIYYYICVYAINFEQQKGGLRSSYLVSSQVQPLTSCVSLSK